MKNPIESIKKIFGKEKKPGEQMEAEVRRQQAEIDKRMAEKARRQKQVADCAAALNDCRMTFNQTILHENALAADTRRRGFDAGKQRVRVREAAIGIMVVDQALLELQSVNSESELNIAMNKMGTALRQLKRLDSSTAAISGSTERILRQWYPAYDQEIAEAKAEDLIVDIPDEIQERIDDTFVKNLMAGDSYEIAMLKSSLNAQKPAYARTAADEMFDQIAGSGRKNRSDEKSFDDVISKHTDHF